MRVHTVLFILLLTGKSWAVPSGRTNFLSHGPGAAQEAMGEAVVGMVSGPEAIYYNSAGLSPGNAGITGEWTRLLPGVNYSWFGAAFDIPFAQMGLGIINLDLGDITARSALDDPGSSIGSHQRAYLIGSSREVFPGWRAGTALGLLDFDLAGNKANAYFADLGFSYKAPETWGAGLAVKNAYFSGLDFGGEKEVYPKEVRLGAYLEKYGFTVSAQVDKVLDGSGPSFSLGGGYMLFNLLSLRAGMNGYPRFGLGFTTKSRLFALDFSYQARAVSASQRVTLSYFFRRQEEEGPKGAYEELGERAESLRKYLSEEARRLLEQHQDKEASEALEKLLALDPGDKDAALALKALTNRVYPSVMDDPWFFRFLDKSRRKAYLRFSVAFAEENVFGACEVAKEFMERWPKDQRSGLIGILVSGKNCSLEKETKEEAK